MREQGAGSPAGSDFDRGVFGGGTLDTTAYPGKYTGGTPTAAYAPRAQAADGTSALLPEQDFSYWELRRKRQQEWSRTAGRARQLRQAAEAGLPLQPWEREGSNPTVAPGGRSMFNVDFLNRQRLERAAALEAEWQGGQQRLPMNHPVLTRVIEDARKQGIEVTANDIRNLTNLGVLDMAANAYLREKNRPGGGNARGMANVLITLQQSSPQMAALLPLYAEQKAGENAISVAQNPSIVEDVISRAADWTMNDPRSPMFWAIKEWETFQHGIRAGQWYQQQVQNEPTDGSVLGGIRQDVLSSVPGIFAGVLSPDAWAATAPGVGAFNKAKLDQIKSKYGVGDDIIDLAVRIADDVNNGRPDTVIEVLTSDTATEQQARFASDILTGKTTLSEFDAVGLIDDVRFADQSNIGRMIVGEYAQDMSTSGKYLTSDLTSLAVGFADPLMFVGAPIRAVTASRYAIAKLAPGMARADYATALASRKVAGVETNRARRYFEGLLRDLDALDELEPGSVKASLARQRIVENYDMIPEDVILAVADPNNVAKVNINGKLVRTMDGVMVDDERVAAGFIDYLYEENSKWLVTAGRASVRAKKAGEASLIQQATAGKIMEGLDHATALKVARENATPEMVREALRVQTGVLMKDMRDLGQPIASRFVQRGRRDPVMPYRGIIGDARRRALNSIVLSTMSTKRTEALVDAFIKSTDPEDLAKALDADTMGAIPRADRQVVPRGDAEGVERPLSGVTGAVLDRARGMFSSMPRSLFINTATGENANEVYLYARQFHTRQTAAFIADKFRTADQGTRRRILAGLIRSTAASRALNLTDDEVKALIGDLATGSRRSEMFAIGLPDIPSAKAMQATLREAKTAGEDLVKNEKKLAKAQRELDQANARLATATAANDEAAIAALQRDVRRLSRKAERHAKSVARSTQTVDAYKKRLVKALRAQDRLRPDEVVQKLPIEVQARIQADIERAMAGGRTPDGLQVPRLAQQVLADNGTLVDDVATPAPVAPGTPAPEAQQIALDAQGMTPPPEQMVGARMAEMPFDEAVGASSLMDDATEAASRIGRPLDEIAEHDLARTIYAIRAEKLKAAHPELGDKVRKIGDNWTVDIHDPAVWNAYMEMFYPGIDDDTVITLFRGMREGEVPGSAVEGSPNGSRLSPGLGAWWSTNPTVAAGFARRSGKIATLDVRIGDLAGMTVDGKKPWLGPLSDQYGMSGEVMLDYTKIGDDVRSAMRVADAPPAPTRISEVVASAGPHRAPNASAVPAQAPKMSRAERVAARGEELAALDADALGAYWERLFAENRALTITGDGYVRGFAEEIEKAGAFLDEGRTWDAAQAIARAEDAAGAAAQVDVAPALNPAEEAAQKLLTFDEFADANPKMDELVRYLEPLQGQPYDEATQQYIDDVMGEIGAEWSYVVLSDLDVQRGYLNHLGLDQDVIPDEYVRMYGAEYDKSVDEFSGNLGVGDRAMDGQVDPFVSQPFARSDTSDDALDWWLEGTLSRARLMDLYDEYGEEGLWAWWKTGNPEAYLADDFFDLHGPAPRMRPDPGKGPRAMRRAARVPGEYLDAAVDIPVNARAISRASRKLEGARILWSEARSRGDVAGAAQLKEQVVQLQRELDELRRTAKTKSAMRVPWAGTMDKRNAHIKDQYERLAEDAIEQALAGRSVNSLKDYFDILARERVLASDAQVAAEDTLNVIDSVIAESMPPQQAVLDAVDEAPMASAVPASEDVVQGTVLNRVDEPIPATEAAAPPAGGPPPPDRPVSPMPEPPAPAPRMPSTTEIEAWLNKYRSEYQSSLYAIDDEMRYSPSRDAMGREHAVNMYQTSDYAVLPSMAQIESFGFFGANPVGRFMHGMAQKPTDLWSLGTLYGFRFAQRSAIEDLMAYLLTGGLGRMGDLYRGRRGSTTLREIGRVRVEPRTGPDGKILKDSNGSPVYDIIVPKNEGARFLSIGRDETRSSLRKSSTSRLGMVARWSRKVGDQIQKSNIEAFQGFVLPNISEDKLLGAIVEVQRGNYIPMRGLIAEAAGRMRFTGLSSDDVQALQDLGGTHAGMMLMNDIAEAGAQVNSGNYRSLASAMDSLADHPDIDWVKSGRPVYFGDYKRLALSAPNETPDPYASWYWHRKLQAIVRDDGPIGAIFIKLMHEPDRAKKAIADAIRKDTRMGYKERFSLISTDASIDDFAHRYFEANLPYFQRHDGTVNEALRSKFIDRWTDPKNGKERLRVSWTQSDSRGREYLRVTHRDLSRLDRKEKPQYVLGRGSTDIPMPTTEKALFDRAWDWMGEQYARIAREPIFIGNYLANRRALKAAGLEDRFAQGFANARAGVDDGAKVLDTDRALARQVVSKQAMDSAYAFTLNYMDNPNNRSVLAWKIRNFSRYYRATEDFARRAYRLAINYPDAYLKLALTYQILDDTGFTYRDSNGDLYFAYPMNGFMQDALSLISGLFPGVPTSMGIATDPFMVGGKVKNIAPSTDPAQWAPTVVGPVGTVPLVTLFNMFPQFQGLRALTLGGYSSAGQSGDFIGDLLDSIVPAGAKRFWTMMDPDERDSSMGSAIVGSLASMYADGTLDDVLDPQTGMLTLEKLKKNDIYGEAFKRAFGITATKMILGYGAPASPQVYQNNISDAAREMGFDGMSDVFHALITQNDGDIAAAYVDWQKMDPDGRLTPFTTSKTKDNPDMLASLAKAQPVAQFAEWTRDPKVRDLAEKFPDTYLFLSPREGEFDWGSWALVKAAGYRVDKTTDEMMIDMFAAQGEALDRKMVAAYEAEIAKYDPTTEEGRAAISALESQRSNDRNTIENMNPYWATKRANTIDFYSLDRLSQSFVGTQDMLRYIEQRDGELTGTAKWIRDAMNVWLQSNVMKDGISYHTEAGRAQRAQIDLDMAAGLEYIAQQDPGAKKFIDTVLSSKTLFDQLKG